jgi:hypothetical protein
LVIGFAATSSGPVPTAMFLMLLVFRSITVTVSRVAVRDAGLTGDRIACDCTRI